MAITFGQFVLFLSCVALLLQVAQAKPHGFKGSRKGRRGIQEKRNPLPEYGTTSTIRTRFTTTCADQNPTPTASSSDVGHCKRTKVAVLGAGVAGIAAAV